MAKQDKKNVSNLKSLTFMKKVAKYFMDFLETDFHRRRIPKRNIRLHSAENLLIGINTNRYPAFEELVWKAVNKSFDKNVIKKISKGVYRTKIPENLVDLISRKVKNVQKKVINRITKKIAEQVDDYAVLYKKEFQKALLESIDYSSEIIKKGLVLPFIESLEKSLEQMELGDENTTYLMEEELTSILVRGLEEKITEILKQLIAGDSVETEKEIELVFNLGDVRQAITTFFENFKVTDLFNEVYEMERNRSILDKQEFYLYFYDISFSKVKYPIFYIPFAVEGSENGFDINFDSQVYINKKAVEYIVQEYNKEKGTRGNLKSITERIIYLAQHQEDFPKIIGGIVDEIINFFELDGEIDITNSRGQVSKSSSVRVSNSAYICLFDKSDEALVNDYEEILQLLEAEDSVLANAFFKLIDDFIHKDPQSIIQQVQDEWDEFDSRDKLVTRSPIPLNSEQRQVLMAIKEDGCKYITVEGPPGTGKSHTITAIVFDAILNNKSVLVLSDKKEALDVVEDKITDTMNKVRVDKNFQNPILRLGSTGNTYSKILSTNTIENIRNHYKAVKKDYSDLEENTSKLINSLKEDIEAESLAYKEIDINQVHDFFDLDQYYHDSKIDLSIDELLDNNDSAIVLEDVRKIFFKAKDLLGGEKAKLFKEVFGFGFEEVGTQSKIEEFSSFLRSLSENVRQIKSVYSSASDQVKVFNSFSDDELRTLADLLDEYKEAKQWLFGYVFKKEAVIKIDHKFRSAFPRASFETPHKEVENINTLYDIFNYANQLKKGLDKKYLDKVDYLKVIYGLLIGDEQIDFESLLTEFVKDVEFVTVAESTLEQTFKKMDIKSDDIQSFTFNKLVEMSDQEFEQLQRYLTLNQQVTKKFNNVPNINYSNQKDIVEDLVTMQMTYLMDRRVTKFYDESRATAKALREIIRTKRQFPKDEFSRLKEAFPCILAGIRDFAEYIPLKPEVFDLLIIDEASQVSIAQAFPALLRAKKVVILGDKKQFSNVKSTQARSETNKEYLNELDKTFKKYVSTDSTKLVRLEKFNIKTSILEFLEYINNYNIQLLKHFRGYKEIISYSNKYFYQDSLQVMKIRGKNIDKVLRLHTVKHDGKEELVPNTNLKEIEYIVEELKRLRESGEDSSVGIITPHTNQQKLLMEKISGLPERDYYFENLKLKIMTFDTCQGEERDIIYYSMVATETSDHLWGVFIKDLSNIDLEENGVIRAQRLNVGFSRAKEQINLVLSKPLDKYTGSIGEALRHYQFVLEEAEKEPDSSQVDSNSPMEKQVLNWLTQTKFYKDNISRVEIMPQFNLGKYLKQLDRTYDHPNYVVDFLLLYEDVNHLTHKIVIEYDGFEYHFEKDSHGEVNEFNYDYYYTDEDVYRQKVLEGYGYKVLRINKFNLGENKIESLSTKLFEATKVSSDLNKILKGVHDTVESLQNGDLKECPKCNELREVDDFKDSSLISGYGRFCRYCKGLSYPKQTSISPQQTITTSQSCPKCKSKMVLRSGRYGKFYGCSRFPYCRGTKQYQQQ